MISKNEYEAAIATKKASELTINAYRKQEQDSFEARWDRFRFKNEYFSDSDLIYSAGARCSKCGAGLAYPRKCGFKHQWTCSDVLKGIGTDSGHEALPFAFYEVKSEEQPSANGATTRPQPK